MGKGSGRRPQNISDEELEKAWNSIFAGHPNDGQFETVKQKAPVVKEDNYGNVNARIRKIEDSDYTPHLRDADWVLLVEGWKKVNGRWKSFISDLS